MINTGTICEVKNRAVKYRHSILWNRPTLPSGLLANFRQVIDAPSGRLGEAKSEGANKKGEVKIHPVVARQVDPELLKKMGAVADAK